MFLFLEDTCKRLNAPVSATYLQTKGREKGKGKEEGGVGGGRGRERAKVTKC